MAKRGRRPWTLLITCEHGGNKVPATFLKQMSVAQKKDLTTHKGWDPGALILAKHAAKALDAPLFYTEISRLLVDCNRSAHHPRCMGPAFRELEKDAKNFLLAAYYWPHRNALEQYIRTSHAQGNAVLHLAMHSFTPVMDGVVRNAEVGLLYDPGRPSERSWADKLLPLMKAEWPDWRFRRNYPYLGKADGLTTFLRKHYGAELYAGMEVEWNQALWPDTKPEAAIRRQLVRCLSSLISD